MLVKSIIGILLILFCHVLFAQPDFSSLLNKKTILEEYLPAFSDFRMNGEVSCFSGDCKNGKGVVKIFNAYRLLVYVAANFEKKQIEGKATIVAINLKADDSDYQRYKEVMSLKGDLEKALQNIESTEVYEYYKNFGKRANEAYYGDFNQNILLDGLYSFNGNVSDLDMQIKSIPLKHLYHITPGNKIESFPLDKHFSFIYKGEFKNGQPDGEGTLTAQNGKVYTGTFKQGIFQK